jgi:hypothetical protein
VRSCDREVRVFSNMIKFLKKNSHWAMHFLGNHSICLKVHCNTRSYFTVNENLNLSTHPDRARPIPTAT